MIITGETLAQVRRLSEAAVELATPMGAEVVSASGTPDCEKIVLRKPDKAVPQVITVRATVDFSGPWLEVIVEEAKDGA